MPADNDNATEPIISQPKSDFYGFIILLAICGIIVAGAGFFAWHESERYTIQDLWIGLTAIFALFFVPCIFMLWLMRHLCVLADARGLHIRGAFKTRFIPWRDIEDYELRPSPHAATARLSWICANGKWQRLPQLYTDMKSLRARIQTEATASRARDWQLSVERDDAQNWPKTYAYRDPSGRLTFALAFGGLLLYFGLSFGRVFSPGSIQTTRLIWNNLDFWGRFGSLLMPLLVLAMFALWLLPIYSVMRAKKRLGAQIISADQNALTLIDGAEQTQIAWHEITDYFLEDAKGPLTLHQCAVESANARLIFRRKIANYNELKALITARAINAKSDVWRSNESADSDTLGGAASLWSGGVAGVGRKVYHYRTRTTRAVLLFGAVMFLGIAARILAGIPLSNGQMPTAIDRYIGLIFVVPIIPLLVGGALAFWRASIQTDADSILQRGIRGERFLKWSEIEAFTFNGYFYSVRGANTTIRYGTVAASDTLQAEVEARTGLKMRRTDRNESDE